MKLIKKYLITLIIGFSTAALIAWSKDVFSQTALVQIFHILCDSFFAVGTVIVCAGLLVFSSNEGTFDIMVYGMNSFLDMFRKKSRKKYDTFYDYRESRADKKIGFGFLLICGLLFVAISLVMYLLYAQHR
ncbi:MAG: DUF3899 domain-containing protein [Clostridia bacterium]|nr:DUF3899 domain-containing protein [Clostridia bacterium]